MKIEPIKANCTKHGEQEFVWDTMGDTCPKCGASAMRHTISYVCTKCDAEHEAPAFFEGSKKVVCQNCKTSTMMEVSIV